MDLPVTENPISIPNPGITKTDSNATGGSVSSPRYFHSKVAGYRNRSSYTRNYYSDVNDSFPRNVAESENQKRVCKFFQNGNCTSGSRCRFLHIPPKSKILQPLKTCKFFQSGQCRFGDKCKFSHATDDAFDASVISGTNQSLGQTLDQVTSAPILPETSTAKTGQNENKLSTPVNNLRNQTPVVMDSSQSPVDNSYLNSASTDVIQPSNAPYGIKVLPIGPIPERQIMQPKFTNISVNEQSPNDLLRNLRDVEIRQFLHRFPRATRLPENEDSFQFVFSPTDPDWPYDVRELQLVVVFPEGYPKEALVIKLPEDESLPNTVRRFVWKSVEDWLVDRVGSCQRSGRVELMFRAFLKWLDKSLLDLFTSGLKLYQKELMARASGIELISASELQESAKRLENASLQSASSGDETASNTVLSNEIDSNPLLSNQNDSNPVPNNRNDSNQVLSNETAKSAGSGSDPAKTGIEIRLENLRLLDNAAMMVATTIVLVIQCSRCKSNSEIALPVLPIGESGATGRSSKVHCVKCVKCNSDQLVSFRAAILHQFSAVAGHLGVDGCVPFDLVLPQCRFEVGCLNCSKEAPIGGLSAGQVQDLWCHFCHQKQRVVVDNVKFRNLQPTIGLDLAKSVNVVVKKPPKSVKDPAVQEGKPLPSNGACKHYRKSYRWFRFPCCGKAYPCDLCHDDQESDHETKLATRVICGHCAKEQMLCGDRPCVACHADMTKKCGAFWEGGTGCRDKIKMSRNDEKKFANSNKTISRKAQDSNEQKGKKIVKVRHS